MTPIKENYLNWKAYSDYGRRLGIHWGWDWAISAVILAIFMALGVWWVGVALNVAMFTWGTVSSIREGAKLREFGSDDAYQKDLVKKLLGR